jgi:hypothetical protein
MRAWLHNCKYGNYGLNFTHYMIQSILSKNYIEDSFAITKKKLNFFLPVTHKLLFVVLLNISHHNIVIATNDPTIWYQHLYSVQLNKSN